MPAIRKMFAKFPMAVLNEEVDLTGSPDTIKCALFTSAHAPDPLVDKYFGDSHGMTEVADATAGYTTGGATCASPTLTQSGYDVIIDCADPTWTCTDGGFTFRYAVFYDSTPTNKPLISFIDFGRDVVWGDGDQSIDIGAPGIGCLGVPRKLKRNSAGR